VDKKKIIYIVLIIFLLFNVLAGYNFLKKGSADLYIFDKKVSSSILLMNGKSFLPLEEFKEIFGAKIKWDEQNKRVILEPSADPFYISEKLAQRSKEIMKNEMKGENYADAGNVANLGLAASDGEMHYIVKYDKTKGKNCLYAVKAGSGDIEQISAVQVWGLAADYENLYYIVVGDTAGQVISGAETDGRAGIYSFNKKTKEKKMLSLNVGIKLIPIGDNLYYLRIDDSSYNLYAVKKDGSEDRKLVNRKIGDMTFSDNYIYYNDYNSKEIYRYNVLNAKEEKIIDKIYCMNMQIVDNRLYLTNIDHNSYLYAIGLNGEYVKQIMNVPIFYINIRKAKDGLEVFYVANADNSYEKDNVFKYAVIDEAENIIIKEYALYKGDIRSVNITGDNIIFSENIEIDGYNRAIAKHYRLKATDSGIKLEAVE
jgi:hypothetical protein